MSPLPNFLLIGAAKSGTSSLAEYLSQHPEIYFSPTKEPNFFAFDGETLPKPGSADPDILNELLYSHSVSSLKQYLDLFQSVKGETAIGEGSVRYLYYPEASIRIHKAIPDVRLVAILRDPVSRLYSHYTMMVQFQLEPLNLHDAIDAEAGRREAGWDWDWHYVNVGLYAQQLKRYFQIFDRDQIKVFLYDDFIKQPLAIFHEICRHIGVNDRFVPDMSHRGMVSYRPRSRALDRWLLWSASIRPGAERYVPRMLPKVALSRLEKWNKAPVPKLPKQERERLFKYFKEDVKELESILGRALPWNE